MQDREVMQMALDALMETETYNTKNVEQYQIEVEAIEALRARLAEPEQEPIAWMCAEDPERETAFSWKKGHCENCGKQRVPVYTAPPQREWRELTDEEITEAMVFNKRIMATHIEAKLKEKNGY